jgi:hypothetical protein
MHEASSSGVDMNQSAVMTHSRWTEKKEETDVHNRARDSRTWVFDAARRS